MKGRSLCMGISAYVTDCKCVFHWSARNDMALVSVLQLSLSWFFFVRPWKEKLHRFVQPAQCIFFAPYAQRGNERQAFTYPKVPKNTKKLLDRQVPSVYMKHYKWVIVINIYFCKYSHSLPLQRMRSCIPLNKVNTTPPVHRPFKQIIVLVNCLSNSRFLF